MAGLITAAIILALGTFGVLSANPEVRDFAKESLKNFNKAMGESSEKFKKTIPKVKIGNNADATIKKILSRLKTEGVPRAPLKIIERKVNAGVNLLQNGLEKIKRAAENVSLFEKKLQFDLLFK